MKNSSKLVGGVALLWWMFSGGSSRRTESSARSSDSKTETPPPTPRPEASKTPPKPTPAKRSPQEKKHQADELKAKKGNRGKKADKKAQELNAQSFAKKAYQDYIDRGQEPKLAAADALALYLLAGGIDGPVIANFQKLMEIPEPSGWYDQPTAQAISELLDPAVEAAVSQYQFSVELGESSDKAAAEALSVYAREAAAIQYELPKERLIILQSQLQVPLSGVYDDETRAALVERGVVPP